MTAIPIARLEVGGGVDDRVYSDTNNSDGKWYPLRSM